jgi:ribosomal protein S18 acetylase RimI-like enzyme
MDEMLVIDHECFVPGIAYSRGEMQSFVEKKGSFGIMAEPTPEALERIKKSNPKMAAHKLAGFIITEVPPKNYGHVITIDTRSQYRRYGLGSMLMAAAEERVRKMDGFMMALEVAVNNTVALAFYKRHKYTVVKTLPRYYGRELDALLLTKRL